MTDDTNFFKAAVARRDLEQRLGSDMTPMEFRIAERLVSLTMDWGKTGINLSWDRLLGGCEISGVHYGPLNISRSSGKRAVRTLIAKNFITSAPVQFNGGAVGARYQVQADWDDDNHTWEWQMVLVSRPKRLRQIEPTPSSDWTEGEVRETCIDTSTETRTVTSSSPSIEELPADQSLRGKLEQHTGKIDKSPSRPRRPDFERIWRQSVEDAYEGVSVPALTPKQRNVLRSTLVKEWVAKPDNLEDFLAWVATNWTRIMRTQFKWMTITKPPKTPDLMFVCVAKFRENFYEAWANRNRDEWINQEEWDSVHRMMEIHGCTQEVAEEKIAQERQQRASRARIVDQEEDLARRERALERGKEELRRDERDLGKLLADKEDALERRRLQEEDQSKGLHKTTEPVYNAYEDPDYKVPEREDPGGYEAEPYEERQDGDGSG